MTKLWEMLSKENKEKLGLIYEKLTGKKWIPPKQKSKDIQIENLAELSKIMKEKPRSGKK